MKETIQVTCKLGRDQFFLTLDLLLPSSGITVLFGPSGSGKTSCLRAIAGLEHPSEAKIRMGNSVWQDTSKGVFVPTHQRHVGYVFQEAGLFPHLTVAQNLDYGYRRTPTHLRHLSVAEICDFLDISELLHRHIGQLSGGEKQRISIARALLTGPDLLLMDEPLAALDAKKKREILPYLESLQRTFHIPIIYVTHDLNELIQLADHVVLLERGHVCVSDHAASVMQDFQWQEMLGDALGNLLEAEIISHHDGDWTELRIDDLHFRMLGHLSNIGERYRCYVRASDIFLSREEPNTTMKINLCQATVLTIDQSYVKRSGLVICHLRIHGLKKPWIVTMPWLLFQENPIESDTVVWVQVDFQGAYD